MMRSNDNLAYEIRLSRDAASFLTKTDKGTQSRVYAVLEALKYNPYNSLQDIKRLAGRNNQYRLRVGKYRIIYTVDHGILLIFVIDIGSRGDIYK